MHSDAGSSGSRGLIGSPGSRQPISRQGGRRPADSAEALEQSIKRDQVSLKPSYSPSVHLKPFWEREANAAGVRGPRRHCTLAMIRSAAAVIRMLEIDGVTLTDAQLRARVPQGVSLDIVRAVRDDLPAYRTRTLAAALAERELQLFTYLPLNVQALRQTRGAQRGRRRQKCRGGAFPSVAQRLWPSKKIRMRAAAPPRSLALPDLQLR